MTANNVHKITDRIDAITRIPEAYRAPVTPCPKSVKIELTGKCNFACTFCARNQRLRKQDEMGFATAVQQFTKLEFEIAFLESGGASDPSRARLYGQRIAASCAAAIGLLVIVVFTLSKL